MMIRELVDAIFAADEARAKELLESGADVNGHMLIPDDLQDVERYDEADEEWRYWASSVLREECHTEVTDWGVDYDIWQIGLTPLYVATSRRQVEMCRLLLKHGADTNAEAIFRFAKSDNREAETDVQQSSLHAAASGGNLELTKLLLEAGADVEVGMSSRACCCSCWFGDTETPLHVAIERGHREVTSVLLQSGANPAAVRTLVTEYTKESYSKKDECPLMTALAARQLDLAAMLIGHGASAVECFRTLENVEYDYGEDYSEDEDEPISWDMESRSGLYEAAMLGDLAAVRLLLRGGADPNTGREWSGRRRDDEFVRDGLCDVVWWEAKQKQSPLEAASEHGHRGVVDLLRETGADPTPDRARYR